MSHRRHIRRLGLLALILGAGGSAQASATGTPQWLDLKWDEIYLQTVTEYEREHQTAGSPGTDSTRTQTIVQPGVGAGVSGSAYHPNLMQFQLNAELGLDYEDTHMDPGGSSSTGKLLQQYHGSADFLSQKPYATTVYGDKDTTYRDYDFFSRYRVITDDYGGRSGYSAGLIPFTVSFQHVNEHEDDPARPMDFWQNTVSLSAQNDRGPANGNTRLNYSLADFSRQDDGFNTTEGINQTLNVTDTEHFGPQKQNQLNSLLNYSSLSQTAQPTDQLMAQEYLRLQHTSKVDSFHTLLFNTTSSGDNDANFYSARSGVHYQVREDLSTSLSGRGEMTRSTSPGSSLDTQNYGPEFDSQYTPTVTSWLRVTVGENAQWYHENQDASGLVQNILNEPHILSDGTVTLLLQPNVEASTILVYGDAAHTILYVLNRDYAVIPQGAFTQIQRLAGGIIPNGATVFVDYTAGPQGSSAYDTMANSSSFRLDFWNGLLGVYGRWTVQEYEGGDNLILRTLNDKTIGVDSAWRWFRVGAEYEAVDSNLSPYNRARFIQSLHFQPGNDTDVTLSADEGWTDYVDTHLRQNSYGLMNRVQQRFTSRMSGGVESGFRIERGDTFDQNLFTCRTWFDCRVGKMTVKLNYEYDNQSYQTDSQERHYVYLSLRRDF